MKKDKTYDSELRDRMVAAHYTQRECAYDMGFTEVTLRNKLKGKSKFSKAEMMLIEILVSQKEKEFAEKQVKSNDNETEE